MTEPDASSPVDPPAAAAAAFFRTARTGINWLSLLTAGLVTTALALFALARFLWVLRRS